MQKTSYEQMGRLTPGEFAAAPRMEVVIVLDNVRSANNVGSFFRTADAFAARGLALCGITACPPSKEIHKTALGAEMTVEWTHYASTPEAIAALKADGYTVVAVEQVGGSVSLQDFVPQPDSRYALVFGNEVDGVGDDALKLCDAAIEIPQAGTKHSLNVSVSGGAVLWHFFSAFIASR